MKHAPLGPSSSHRWLKCPGSVAVNSTRDNTKTNIHAQTGTVAHALLEVCMRLDCEPDELLDAVLVRGMPTVDADMADAVGYALDYVRGYLANNPEAKVFIEHRVHFGEEIGASDDVAFGTSDLLIDNYPQELVCIDYKHGIGVVVSVKDNSQLQLYLLGKRRGRRYRRYRAVVIQPRARGRKPVQEAPAVPDKHLEQFAAKVRKVVPIALSKNAPRVAGDHCRFCAAHGNCPAQYKLVMDAAKKEFGKL